MLTQTMFLYTMYYLIQYLKKLPRNALSEKQIITSVYLGFLGVPKNPFGVNLQGVN